MKELNLSKLFVSCTQDEYNNIEDKDENTIHFTESKEEKEGKKDSKEKHLYNSSSFIFGGINL